MKSYYLAIVMLLAGLLPVYAADVVTTEPSPLQESSTGRDPACHSAVRAHGCNHLREHQFL